MEKGIDTLNKFIFFILLILISSTFSCCDFGLSSQSEWYIYTEKAITLFYNENIEQDDVCTYAAIMYAIGLIYGWDHPDVSKYLEKIISLRNPDGGYGLNKECDAFGDGTINPPDTTYTITTDFLVGIPLLEAFKAGIVSEEDIYSLIDLLLSAPFGDNEKPGICIAYSFHPNDQVGCVHNVNASVGYFFSKAIDYGFKRDKMIEYINLITQREVYSYLPDEKGWYYWEGSSVIEPRLNDPNHAAASALFMRPMAPTIAYEAGKHVMDNIINNEYALIGYLCLLPYFTEYSDELLTMYKTYIDEKKFTTIRRLSEIIKYGAIITSCGL